MSLHTSVVNTPIGTITVSTSNPVHLRVNGVYVGSTATIPPRKALEDVSSHRVNEAGFKDLSEGKRAKIDAFTALRQADQPAIAVAAPKAASKPASASKKRKSNFSSSLEDDIAEYKKNLDHIEVDTMIMDLSCDQVRTRINRVLDSGIMKKGEFADAIGSSAKSLNGFLGKHGEVEGANFEAYPNAWAWFKRREVAGLKMPDVKKRQKAEAAAAAATGVAGTTATASSRIPAPPTIDLSHIHLPGEETDSVEVFDSCDEIRLKINAHLQTPGLTLAQFCRDLHAQLNHRKLSGIQSKQLNDFRGKKGARAGCTSTVFYTAYVYFEKLRLAQGKPKSNHRVAMEKIWGDRGGFDLRNDGSRGFFMSANTVPVMDQYGRVSCRPA